MLPSRFARIFAASAATVALLSTVPAFAAQGSTRSAVRPHANNFAPHTAGRTQHVTPFNGATLDPNGGSVDTSSLSGMTPPSGGNVNITTAVRPGTQPSGQGIAIDPNG